MYKFTYSPPTTFSLLHFRTNHAAHDRSLLHGGCRCIQVTAASANAAAGLDRKYEPVADLRAGLLLHCVLLALCTLCSWQASQASCELCHCCACAKTRRSYANQPMRLIHSLVRARSALQWPLEGILGSQFATKSGGAATLARVG